MYLFKTSIANSTIEGMGVFADEDIQTGSVVWKFNPNHDLSLSPEAFQELNADAQTEIRKVAYVSPTSSKWIYPPQGDPARYTNHSETSNNLSAVFDQTISDEPFFVANKNIPKGTELTVNYTEFDASIKQAVPEWMQS